MKNIITVLIFTVLFTACSNTQPAEKKTELPVVVTIAPDAPAGWIDRWLQKIPCSAPCWENITPGKTTSQEAEQIIRAIPYAYDISIDPEFVPGRGVIEWKIEDKYLGQIGFDSNTPQRIINQITPSYNSTKLSEVINAYGEPDYVIAAVDTPSDIGEPLVCSLTIIYLSKGISLDAPNCPGIKSEIEPASQFYVTFFIPTQEGFKQVTNVDLDNVIVKRWEGYKKFDYYCTDNSGGIYCEGKQ
jgi:hypothetical protein